MTSILRLLKSVLITLAAAYMAAYVLLSSPLSTPALMIPSHLQSLPESIERAGIEVRVNDKNLCGKDSLGIYFPGKDTILVCNAFSSIS